MQWTTVWIQVTCVRMVIEAIILGTKAMPSASFAIAKRHQQGMEFSIISFFVCLWAACMYLLMSFGHAVVMVGGQVVYWGTLSRLDCHHTTATPRSGNKYQVRDQN